MEKRALGRPPDVSSSLKAVVGFFPSFNMSAFVTGMIHDLVDLDMKPRFIDGTASQWAKSEMDAVKMQALVAAEKIPANILVGGEESKNLMNSRGDLGKK